MPKHEKTPNINVQNLVSLHIVFQKRRGRNEQVRKHDQDHYWVCECIYIVQRESAVSVHTQIGNKTSKFYSSRACYNDYYGCYKRSTRACKLDVLRKP